MPLIALASYPRSGNTMLRAYLEKIMGLATGSDGDIDKKLVKQLMENGFVAEGLADHQVQIVKTHFPERYGTHKFKADKAILLVRNPLDCITSLYHMMATSSHTYSISDEDFEKFLDEWDEHVRREITIWNDFHLWWMNKQIAVHIIRFEDLIDKPYEVLKSVIQFILDVKSIEGTIIEHNLQMAIH